MGRFQKRSIVSVDKTRPVAPSIMLKTRGLRRFLRQWVRGGKERGLFVPLDSFDLHQRNGKDATGKSNKYQHSKRRSLAVAVILSLGDAFESCISFSDAIVHDKKEKPLESIPISEWDNIAARYIKGKRRLTDAEVRDLGKRCTEAERSICYLREKSKMMTQ